MWYGICVEINLCQTYSSISFLHTSDHSYVQWSKLRERVQIVEPTASRFFFLYEFVVDVIWLTKLLFTRNTLKETIKWFVDSPVKNATSNSTKRMISWFIKELIVKKSLICAALVVNRSRTYHMLFVMKSRTTTSGLTSAQYAKSLSPRLLYSELIGFHLYCSNDYSYPNYLYFLGLKSAQITIPLRKFKKAEIREGCFLFPIKFWHFIVLVFNNVSAWNA